MVQVLLPYPIIAKKLSKQSRNHCACHALDFVKKGMTGSFLIVYVTTIDAPDGNKNAQLFCECGRALRKVLLFVGRKDGISRQY